MKELEMIRAYYKPMQSSLGFNGTLQSNILYHEVTPAKAAHNFVYCFWQLKTLEPLKNDFVYKVVSDGCIDIFFEHNHPAQNFVMGFCKTYTEFPIGKSFDYVGVRFFPSAFPILFNFNAKLLSDKSTELKNILPDLSNWISKSIYSEDSFNGIVEKLNIKLAEIIRSRPLIYDSRFFKALQIIFEHDGFLETETQLDADLSSRQLQRIFNYFIGTTTKSFSDVVRFQYILNKKSTLANKEDKLFYLDVGFYDQAHFIKNFKKFYGVTPSEAFR
ncbi:AraC family transcriptional regulator [Zunongwangia sp. SCSIO 43204]|uniref:AraC family transcriptional regulator n=1 Tax=Zunongwangia sp. SCSIO 43204 TaxID=2779359 RepID=UPI001CA9D9E5|nr:helix-turn-helix domain-containing protein [Zunongwangia sp. SCSIO 43204]UAB84568.1 AraC family transcriptional regulator [Zunongwangia sp. SCSIO 43204]